MGLCVLYLLLAASLAKVQCQVYDDHRYVPVTIITQTVYETVTKTHTLRETSTSDVWITDQTTVVLPVTQYTTDWDFVSSDPNTRTSVVRVTSTPVDIVTATVAVVPVRTHVSVYTSFHTTTTILEYWQSITHVSLEHLVVTVADYSTQELVQEIISTTTEFVTSTTTSTTFGYH
ncbi:uncharacterized protein LOC121857444 [Homarus americanus]|uniref:uncharacterized protein LOC121857444 n=1 Tax=Homarus americanus TaxID=6706 RepID=UPI001C48EF6F|nr:uncharacterized protein LOC121857444 [Homarus americanus]